MQHAKNSHTVNQNLKWTKVPECWGRRKKWLQAIKYVQSGILVCWKRKMYLSNRDFILALESSILETFCHYPFMLLGEVGILIHFGDCEYRKGLAVMNWLIHSKKAGVWAKGCFLIEECWTSFFLRGRGSFGKRSCILLWIRTRRHFSSVKHMEPLSF